MHKLPAPMEVREHELSELCLILERQTGILLDTATEKLAQVVSEMLRSRHIGSTSVLLERLRSSAAECEPLAEHLLNGETRFFRYPAAFEALAKIVLPDLEVRKSGEDIHRLRILSAGCSTGEEAYSIAMSVCEVVNSRGGGWNVNIVASDIRRQALEFAKRGLYPQIALEHLSRQLVEAYFSRVGGHLLVKPRLRNLVRFSHMNLARPAFLGQFDCIFCMDVLPHFSIAQRAASVERLHLYLQPGGYLFLGAEEGLPAAEVTFHCEQNRDYTMYRKPRAAAAKSGR